jgi:hypothetical protein
VRYLDENGDKCDGHTECGNLVAPARGCRRIHQVQAENEADRSAQ